MWPLTASRPKVMLPLAGRPLLDHLVRRVGEAGISDILIIDGYEREKVRRFFQETPPPGIQLDYVDDEYFNRGNAFSLSLAATKVTTRSSCSMGIT